MRRPQNLKKSPTGFDKTAVFIQYRQNKEEVFQIFVAFSEKLDFKHLQRLCLKCDPNDQKSNSIF